MTTGYAVRPAGQRVGYPIPQGEPLTTTTVSTLKYRPRIAAANCVLGGIEAAGFPLGYIDAESIVASARRSTGLHDMGGDEYLPGLNKIVETVRARTTMTPLARVMLRQSFIRAAQNRLLLQEWLRTHPEIREKRIERPIFVLGFPRTGTTLLQNLLAADQGRRALEFWELTIPVPAHDDPERDFRSRKGTVKWIIDAAYQVAPEMAQVHAIETDSLEECWPLFAASFTVMNWDLQSGLEDYGRWLESQDISYAYRKYADFLKVLVDRRPASQLVLKCPEHLWFLDALLEVFPDACIVWTHRDPYDTIASYCSLMSMTWRTLYGVIEPHVIGRYLEQRLHDGITRAMSARTRHDPARFIDVRFADLVRDPLGTAKRVHEHFALPWRPELDQKARDFLDQKRADARGEHKYEGAFYGLDREEVAARFQGYIDTFGVPVSDRKH